MLARLLVAGLLLPVLSPPVPAAAPQDELQADLAFYRKIIKGKGQESEAIALMDRFVQAYKADAERLRQIEEALEFGEGSARDLKAERKSLSKETDGLAKAVFSAFSRRRVTEPHMRLWTAAAFALGRMGHSGAEYLWKIFGDKRFSQDVEFRSLVVRQVGETRDFTQAKRILDTFDYHEEVVAAAAAEAAQLFSRAPGTVRREMVARLVVLLESRHNDATDFQNTTARRIYTTVRGPFIDALSALTGQTFRDPLDWTKWWNENKKNADAWPDHD